MIEDRGICPLCEKPTANSYFAEMICSLCGMGIDRESYYMIGGAGTSHYFCSSKCVVSYVVSKEVLR